MTSEKIELLKKIKVKTVHFAWDRYEDRDIIVSKLREFATATGWNHRKMIVYMLTNFDTTIDQDLERIYTLRDLGYSPYMMIYDKEHLPNGHTLRRMQRWVNCNALFRTVERFEDYNPRRERRDEAEKWGEVDADS